MAQEQEGADKVLLFQNSTYMYKKKKENTLPVTDRISTWDLSVYSRML